MKLIDKEERILELKNIYKKGINLDLFEKLILHSTDDDKFLEVNKIKNEFTVEDWKNLYDKSGFEEKLNTEQLELFFIYMVKYYRNYFGKRQDKFFVLKKELNKDAFSFEENILLVLELVL